MNEFEPAVVYKPGDHIFASFTVHQPRRWWQLLRWWRERKWHKTVPEGAPTYWVCQSNGEGGWTEPKPLGEQEGGDR
jgi:hypothetical protein